MAGARFLAPGVVHRHRWRGFCCLGRDVAAKGTSSDRGGIVAWAHGHAGLLWVARPRPLIAALVRAAGSRDLVSRILQPARYNGVDRIRRTASRPHFAVRD